MMSPVDYNTSSSVWTQTDKWKGRMEIRWIFVKDIPNSQLRHIRVWNNENKPVTNSRDTQELPPEAGLAMLRIFAEYPPKTSVILSNLVNAEMKEDLVQKNGSVNGGGDGGEGNRMIIRSMDSSEFNNNGGHYTNRQSTDDYRMRESWHQLQQQQERSNFDNSRNNSVASAALYRRNTISSALPSGTATNRGLTSSTTPTSGMRSHDASPYFNAPSSHVSTYRTALSGFTGLTDGYTTNRYPPFPAGEYRYDETARYF